MESTGSSTIMDNMAARLTPREWEKRAVDMKVKIGMIIQKLSFHWSLCLQLPTEGESPSKRKENRSKEQEIVSKIIVLCWKGSIDPLIRQFEAEAKDRLTRWVKKPKAERGVLPEKTRDSRIVIRNEERQELLDCLREILTEAYDATKTPKKQPIESNASMGARIQQRLDDSPIPFNVSKPGNDCKRLREQLPEKDGSFKKPKVPELKSDLLSMQTSFETNRSAKTSFASNASSVFSNPRFNISDESLPAFTQDTVLTQDSASDEKEVSFDAQAYRDPLNMSFQSHTQSSDYEGASSFDADLVAELDPKLVGVGRSDPIIDEELSQDMGDQVAIIDEDAPGLADVDELDLSGDELRARLQRVFPTLPPSLRDLPLYVTYEITRVFLHAEVAMEEVKFPPSIDFNEYDRVWKFLQSLPCLQGKLFPDKCGQQVWNSVVNRVFQGRPMVPFMSGSLKFNPLDKTSPTSPLFRFQLHPLTLDLSHRVGRRFGHDRFFEVDVPDLTSQRTPRLVQQLGVQGPALIIEWLVDECHHFLGRVWKPFFVKPKERPKRKAITTQKATENADPNHRVTFFAIDGTDFVAGSIPLDCSLQLPVKISIEELLDRIRPTKENTSESFLKLFSRTALALSRNTPTVVLERSQIKEKPDIMCGDEKMTDGGGRISPMLALRVIQMMKLSYFPSAFQGRLGEAKGLWTVHHQDTSGEEWIEVYKSQQKWTRNTESSKESDDISHRTFEVLKVSAPLKSAALNLQFLPLLMDRAISKPRMQRAIEKILRQGLRQEITSLSKSMESPQSSRKWIRDTRPNVKERLNLGAVEYQAGLPVSLEERMNALLDAGFDAKRLFFMTEIYRTIIKIKCDELKERLNITVPNSTNVLMVPDFLGVLEPGQVYIDLSNFPDKTTGLPGHIMNGVSLLVARSPAHFVSDIQKVTAVLKVEYMEWRSVIVFPTKGTPSLAKKLSGGDYDGDIAWVCWEKSLVENFVPVDPPEGPDLIEEGYVRKDSTTYEDLVRGHANPTSIFLKRAFEFNMQPSLLGKCTLWKEDVCYAQGSVNTEEAVRLSTLLALLVDQSKQGFIFTEEDRLRLRQERIRVTTQQPQYKGDVLDANARHIIDRLKYVANETVEEALTEFHKGLPKPSKWDKDLVEFYKWAEEKAKSQPDWAKLLKDLDSDILILKSEWASHCDQKEKLKTNFVTIKADCYEMYQAIQPHEDTAFTQALSPDCFPDSDVSAWSLLKASALFASYHPEYVRNAVWWLAGRQLCILKAIWMGNMTVVAPWMYAILGPISSLVKALESKETPADADRAEDLDDIEDGD